MGFFGGLAVFKDEGLVYFLSLGMDFSPCLWIKLFHSHEEEVGRGSCFFPVAFSADFSQQETSLNRMSKRELSSNFWLIRFWFFFVFTCIFFFCGAFLSQLPLLLCFALLLCSAPCSCADLLLCSLQLCLSCLGCLKQLVGNDAGYHGGYKENRCAALPHLKGPPDLSKPILLASASFCQVNPAQLVVCVCLYMLFLFTAISMDIEAKVNHGISLMFLQVNEILS